MGDKSHKLSLSKRVTKISTIDQLRGKKNEVSYRSVSKLCSRLKICQKNPPENLNLFLAPGNITDQSQMEIEPIIAWTLMALQSKFLKIGILS